MQLVPPFPGREWAPPHGAWTTTRLLDQVYEGMLSGDVLAVSFIPFDDTTNSYFCRYEDGETWGLASPEAGQLNYATYTAEEIALTEDMTEPFTEDVWVVYR